jgi:hypothetical protein
VSRASLRIGRWLVAGLISLPTLAGAQDVYIEAKAHTDAVQMMGQSVPAQDGINRTWIGEGKIAILDETAGHSVILRADQGKMYVLFPKDKTFYESKLPFEFPAEISQMMDAMDPQVSVMPTTQSKVVNGFETTLTQVQIKMMGQDIAMDFWVSKDLGISLDQVRSVSEAMFAGNPMFKDLGEKMAAIEGYPVRIDTRVSVMGSTFGGWQEVQKVEKKAAPAGTYEVPEGYTKTEKFALEQR